MTTGQRRLFALLLVGSCLQGCTYGVVHDAVTGVPIDSVVIELVAGDCRGEGCAAPTVAVTNGFGHFVFDPYSAAPAQLVVPPPGQEAMELRLSRPGYQSVTLFHRPDYQRVGIDGVEYLVSFVGKVYLCADPSLDSDGDGLCDAAEARYGTDPDNRDTDGDSLSDTAELLGHEQLDLRYFGATPLRRDVLLEIDYYPELGPFPGAIERVVAAFAAAPVVNPDGSTGIHLAIDVSDEIAPADADPDLDPVFKEFDVIKDKYFPARRAPVFHYGLLANQIAGSTYSGMSRALPASDFVIALGSAWYVPGGWMLAQAGTLMHELGHNLGLHHGGFNDAANLKPNYLSVMSYYYQVIGLTVDGETGVLDYSRLHIDAVDESDLNEQLAFAPVPGSPTTEADLSRYGVLVVGGGFLKGNASESLDFDRDNIIEAATAVDLDGDGRAWSVVPASGNDWERLVYHGGGVIGDGHLAAMSPFSQQAATAPQPLGPCMPWPGSAGN